LIAFELIKKLQPNESANNVYVWSIIVGDNVWNSVVHLTNYLSSLSTGNPLLCDCDMIWIPTIAQYSCNKKLYDYLLDLNCTVKNFEKYNVTNNKYTYKAFFSQEQIQDTCYVSESCIKSSTFSIKIQISTLATFLINCLLILF